MFAIIRTGAKQYKVTEGDVIDVELLNGSAGDKVSFGEVLLLGDSKNLNIGLPLVEKASVSGEIVDQFKDKKIIVFKHKAKKRYRRKAGHRQKLTKVKVTKIG